MHLLLFIVDIMFFVVLIVSCSFSYLSPLCCYILKELCIVPLQLHCENLNLNNFLYFFGQVA